MTESKEKKSSLGKFEYKEKLYTLKELSEISGLTRETIRLRYSKGLRDDALVYNKNLKSISENRVHELKSEKYSLLNDNN